MLRIFDALERDQQGYATTNGLLAVVNGLKAMPGRKTIVFFSEGLAITANVQAKFRSVIASANRANVSHLRDRRAAACARRAAPRRRARSWSRRRSAALAQEEAPAAASRCARP